MKHSKDINHRLKTARQRAGFRSARAFAMAYNLPYISYSQYEAGGRNLTPDKIIDFANKLGVSAAWLLTGSELIHQEMSVPTDLATLRRDHAAINAEVLADIIMTVNSLVKKHQITLPERERIILSIKIYEMIENKEKKATDLQSMILDLLFFAVKKVQSKGAA